MEYKGQIRESSHWGVFTTNYRGIWSKDENANVFLKTRETEIRVRKSYWEPEKKERVEKDEYELYVPNGDGLFTMVSAVFYKNLVQLFFFAKYAWR